MSCISSGSKEPTLGSRTTKEAEVALVRLPAEEYITFVYPSILAPSDRDSIGDVGDDQIRRLWTRHRLY